MRDLINPDNMTAMRVEGLLEGEQIWVTDQSDYSKGGGSKQRVDWWNEIPKDVGKDKNKDVSGGNNPGEENTS